MKTIACMQVYDTLAEIVHPKHTCVLVIDMQNDFCSKDGLFAKDGKDVSMIIATIPKIKRVLDEARRRKVFVAHTQNIMLRNNLSSSPAWLHLNTKHGYPTQYGLEGTSGADFVPELRPIEGEPVVIKHRSSGFVNTNLDLILRSKGIESIVVMGCVTHGCVESTIRHGSFLDYYTVVLSDCVASVYKELHEAAIKIMSLYQDIATSGQVLEEWRKIEKKT